MGLLLLLFSLEREWNPGWLASGGCRLDQLPCPGGMGTGGGGGLLKTRRAPPVRGSRLGTAVDPAPKADPEVNVDAPPPPENEGAAWGEDEVNTPPRPLLRPEKPSSGLPPGLLGSTVFAVGGGNPPTVPGGGPPELFGNVGNPRMPGGGGWPGAGAAGADSNF